MAGERTGDKPLLRELELHGMGTAWDDALAKQDANESGRQSDDEMLPPLLKLIATRTFSFIARDPADENLESPAHPSRQFLTIDLESGDLQPLSPSIADLSEVIVSPRMERFDRAAVLERTSSEVIVSRGMKNFDRVAVLERTSSAKANANERLDADEMLHSSSQRDRWGRFSKHGGGRNRINPLLSPQRKVEMSKKFSVEKEKPKVMKEKARPKLREKFYSQPIPVRSNDSDMLRGATRYSGPLPCSRLRNVTRMKDQNYVFFMTRSSKLDRQITLLQSQCPQEGQGQHGLPPGIASPTPIDQGMPVGRYFDALKGPELEILKESEEILLPLDQKWPFLLRFPIGCFGVTLGLGSQTILWKTLATAASTGFLHIPMAINLTLWCLAVIAFITVFTIYSLKCVFYFEAVKREFYHPVRINFFFAPWIACMFLMLGVPPTVTTSIHPIMWCLFMTPIFILELKIYGQWLSGGQRRLSKVANPSTHLSLVGNFVGALLAAEVGWRELAIFFWAVGLAHYLVLFVTLYQRLPTAEVLPKELHPVFFLFVAAPSTASVAWKHIAGDFDFVSRIAYFVGLFLYSSLVVRLNFFRGFRFSIAWWAYTFPMTAAAIATTHYSLEVKHPVTQALAILLSSISAITVLTLFVSTIFRAFMWGDMFPNDLAIAITSTRHKRKKTKGSDSKSSLSKIQIVSNSSNSDSGTVLHSVKSDPLPAIHHLETQNSL